MAEINCLAGILKGCKGDCCGLIPIDNDILKANLHNFQVEPIELISDGSDTAIPITEDLKCVFFHRGTSMCAIYENRPDVCRKYGTIPELPCPIFNSDGDMRTRSDRRRTYADIKKHFGLVALEAKKVIRSQKQNPGVRMPL